MSPAPSLPSDRSAAARAPVVGSCRACPVCRGFLPEGRTTCSGRCRAALSRQRRDEAKRERDRRVRELLEEALRLL